MLSTAATQAKGRSLLPLRLDSFLDYGGAGTETAATTAPMLISPIKVMIIAPP